MRIIPVLLCIFVLIGCDHRSKELLSNENSKRPLQLNERKSNTSARFNPITYYENLKGVDFTQIDYPSNGSYQYRFNGYALDFEVPSGFSTFEISADRFNQSYAIRQNKSDACLSLSGHGEVCATSSPMLFWKMDGAFLHSDSSLCINDTSYVSKSDVTCNGFLITPIKPRFATSSLKDYRFYFRDRLSSKLVGHSKIFAIEKGAQVVATTVIENEIDLVIRPDYEYAQSKSFSKDLYFSLIKSIRFVD